VQKPAGKDHREDSQARHLSATTLSMKNRDLCAMFAATLGKHGFTTNNTQLSPGNRIRSTGLKNEPRPAGNEALFLTLTFRFKDY
jgi:hypothetical protein